jgi:hypothetical protein
MFTCMGSMILRSLGQVKRRCGQDVAPSIPRPLYVPPFFSLSPPPRVSLPSSRLQQTPDLELLHLSSLSVSLHCAGNEAKNRLSKLAAMVMP